MYEILAFAVTGVIIATISPAVFVWMFGRQQVKREDKIALALAKVAATNEENRREVTSQLRVIHTLVNDKLTRAYTAQRAALVGQLALMEEDSGNGDKQAARDDVRAAIDDLDATLVERAEQDDIANEQMKADETVKTLPDG